MAPSHTSITDPRLQPLADLDEAVTWAMVESSPDGMLLADEHGVLLLVNTQIETLFGYDRGELLGLTVEKLITERHRSAHMAHRTRYADAPRPRAMGSELALQGRRRDGTEFAVEVSLSPITTDRGLRVVATVRDITERLAVDDALQRNESRLRILHDRERLARDMHDTVIQRLFGAGMGLQAVVGSITDPHVAQRVSDTVDELDRTISDLRVAIFELTKVTTATVTEQIQEIVDHSADHLACTPSIDTDGDVDSIRPEHTEQLLPVLTEALSNVARHARATVVVISLRVARTRRSR
ncbi:MAG: PAS domain S-box protein [Ilumatobacter sp.]|uniref:sensor histidine kinase n=1 Tax=Ilumatobacter sp. TaxID=1967498 RepID=UPI00329903EA